MYNAICIVFIGGTVEKINWYGMFYLTLREVKRFLKVYNQTIFTPMISALLFLTIFVLATGGSREEISGIKFINFIGYGLIIMSIMQQTFANSSSSFIMSKILGYINDILMPPLGSVEIICAFTLGAVLRGVLVGIVVAISLIPFIDYNLVHPVLLALYILLCCTFLGQLGLLTGLASNSFDQMSAFTSYIITPLSFLSGTFYSVKSLPMVFQYINMVNPYFYVIDGFRYCLTGYADGNTQFGIIFLVFMNILLFQLLLKLISSGWKIKT